MPNPATSGSVEAVGAPRLKSIRRTARSAADGFRDFLVGVAGAWRTYRDLSAFDGANERMLGDIGLTRAELRGMLSGSWWSRSTRELISATIARRARTIRRIEASVPAPRRNP